MDLVTHQLRTNLSEFHIFLLVHYWELGHSALLNICNKIQHLHCLFYDSEIFFAINVQHGSRKTQQCLKCVKFVGVWSVGKQKDVLLLLVERAAGVKIQKKITASTANGKVYEPEILKVKVIHNATKNQLHLCPADEFLRRAVYPSYEIGERLDTIYLIFYTILLILEYMQYQRSKVGRSRMYNVKSCFSACLCLL